MIESRYWKEELLRIAKTLQPVKSPARWSERAHCVIERDLMIGFFLLRRLIELKRVSSMTRDRKLNVYSYSARGKNVNRLNGADLMELYELENQVSLKKSPLYISNQFIHAYTSFVERDETRNWSDVILVSDFDRNDCVWRIPIREIETLFKIAANDYPAWVQMTFNPKIADYDIQTD